MTARTVLREQANLNATRLAGRILGAALDPAVDDAKAAGIALRVIETAEPRDQASLEIEGALSPEAMDGLSFRELVALAQQHDILPAATPPELPA